MPIGRSKAVSWVIFMILCSVAALVWFMDDETLLRSTQPQTAWITLAFMWIEIAALMAALILRFRRGQTGLGLAIGVACAALSVNVAGAALLWPAIVLP